MLKKKEEDSEEASVLLRAMKKVGVIRVLKEAAGESPWCIQFFW